MTGSSSRAARVWWERNRSRAGDVVLVTLGVLTGALVVLARLPDGITAGDWGRGVLTVVASVGLWWRRSRPLLVTVVAAAAVSAGAALVLLPMVLLSLGVHRRGRTLALGVLVCEAAYLVHTWRDGPRSLTLARAEGLLVGSALVVGLAAAVGAYVGARRALVASLHERAERAETDQTERVERARAAERTRIAREMHDVLGHRISLVALHAGALEIAPAVGSDQVERAAALIRTTAHQAMQELRAVLGVLRETPDFPDQRAGPVVPQPTLTDVAQLVHDHTEAGMDVTLHDDLETDAAPPALVGRTAYRVVQESLTNAARHAPGAAVTLRTGGSPDAGLDVELVNTRAPGPGATSAVAGSGLGLVGLRERVELVGGRLDAGPVADGGFRLHAWLPWHREDEQAVTR